MPNPSGPSGERKTWPKEAPTVADVLELIEQLGGIPPRRVLLQPLPGKATEKDLLVHQKRTGRICELIEGTLVEKPAGYSESCIASEINMHLRLHAKQYDLGEVSGEQGTMRLMPHLVRVPDVAFTRKEKFLHGILPSEPIPDLVPDLVVEVLSDNNTPGEMLRKLKEYFLTGTTVVWIVDPRRRQVMVYTSPDARTIYREADTLEGGELLPGFRLRVADLFRNLPSRKKKPSRKKS